MRIIKLITIGVLVLLVKVNIKAQSLPVGTPVLEDYYRRMQLLGKTDTNISFTVRPINPTLQSKNAGIYYPDSSDYKRTLTESTWESKNGKLQAGLLPFNFQSQINTHHPYGWNDGAMIPAKGLQILTSMGFYAKYGILSIQFRPEVVLASNSGFDTFNKEHYDVVTARYYDIYNNIELPVRFGKNAYGMAYWGQSNIKLNFTSFQVGLSTENLWWGPGLRNSLLMSNNAPGFKHFTLNTSKPIQTPVGFFEGQIIAGRLSNAGYEPLEPGRKYFGTDLYVPKPDYWRYLTGIIVTWQPKWVPGLFLGFAQSKQMYGKDLNSVGDYLPLFSQVQSVNAPDNTPNKQDQLSSAFMRWVWPKEHAEIYFEFGHYNYKGTFTQALLSPDNSRAYTFGLRKLLPFNKSRDENIVIGVEFTQMQENSIAKILSGDEWYTSKGIRQGYTYRGEVLGAGIGPGSNLQSIEVSWVKGLKRLGVQIERYLHNNDFYYYTFSDSVDPRRHWVDLSLAFNGEWNYKNLIFNAKLQGIKSLNYQWYLKQNPGDPIWINGTDAFNLQVQTGISYRF